MKSVKSIAIIAILILLAAITLFAGIDLRLYVTYAIFAIAILALVAFTAYSAATSGKKSMTTIILGAALVGIVLLFYFITPTDDVPVALFEKTGTSMGWSAIIGAGLFSIYALLGIFVALLVFFGVKNIVNK
ncbi:MAG: hypothetical protein AB7V36_10005 [Bacteroidales bacterium]|nr:hypothetical protein [Bacteroidales bacterium]